MVWESNRPGNKYQPPLLNGYLTLGTLFHLSKPQCAHFQNGHTNTYLTCYCEHFKGRKCEALDT